MKRVMKQSRAGREQGAVMAIVLMVMAAILVTAVMMQTFTGGALPAMTKARVSSNEASAVAALRVINSAQASYSTTCANGGFAVSLEDLAKPPSGQDVAFVSSDIGKNGVVKNGYTLTMALDGKPGVIEMGAAASTCNAAAEPPASSYFVSAAPAAPGTSGEHYFASDARGVVFASDKPISNPIVESETVRPVQGGQALEKLDQKVAEAADKGL